MAEKLFVYGSLRSGFRNPAYDYITGNFKLIGEALVRGRLFDAGHSPVAVPDDGDFYISGELYELLDPEKSNWVFGQLDDYEGVDAEPGETADYKRIETEVYQYGEPCKAWIYWYNRNIHGLPPLEQGEVMRYLQEKNKPK